MSDTNLLGYNVFKGDLAQKIKSYDDNASKVVINTINPHSYAVSKSDTHFVESLKKSDVLVPDGSGIVLAAKIIQGKKIKKIAGFDVFSTLMTSLEQTKGKVFFMGSTNEVLNKIQERLKIDYPSVQVRVYSPPYKPKLTIEDNKAIFKEIDAFKPDVLFVGMTAPKQEKWVYEQRENLNSKYIATIGAVFDFYAGTIKRPSKFWIDLGLEWLPRLVGEPKRLWQRTFVSAPIFLKDVFIEKLTGNVSRRSLKVSLPSKHQGEKNADINLDRQKKSQNNQHSGCQSSRHH